MNTDETRMNNNDNSNGVTTTKNTKVTKKNNRYSCVPFVFFVSFVVP